MRTIGFINWKGGVGKTTLSTNSAYALGEAYNPDGEVRVLFIDADKQGNASKWFGADPARGSLADILLGRVGAEEVIQHTRYPHIDIIPADASLIQANYAVLLETERRQDNILREALRPVRDRYSLCIIDFPPDSNLPVLNCLEVMDDVIAVTLPNRFSLDGVYALQQEIDNYNRDLSLGLFIRGVVINKWTPFNFDISQELRKTYKLFPSISGGSRPQRWLDRCINEQKSIYELSPRSGFARDLNRFLRKLADVIRADVTGEAILW